MAAVSILGWFPQSAQYMVLKGKNSTIINEDIYGNFAKPQQAVSPALWIYYNGVGLVYHSRDEGLAVLAGHLSHFNNVSTRVGPVQVTSHPVHSYATRHLQFLNLDTRCLRHVNM